MNDGFIKLFIINDIIVDGLHIGEHGGENLIIKFFVKLSYYFVHGIMFDCTMHWIDVRL